MKKSIVSRFKIQSMVIEQWSNRLLWHWNEIREIETKKNPFQLQRRIIFTSSPYSLRKRTRARMAWFQRLRLIARDKSSLPACLQPLFRWNEAGSCGNSPQPATTTSSVLFRSMPFPCPQNIRLLIMAPASPPWDSITPSNARLLFTRVPHAATRALRLSSQTCATFRNFGAVSTRSKGSPTPSPVEIGPRIYVFAPEATLTALLVNC